MFVDEDQWARAFKAAKNEVDTLYAQGLIDVPSGRVNGTLHRAAVAIATAALRAATRDDEGDIGELSGVHIDEIHNHTRSNQSSTTGMGMVAAALPRSEEEDKL